MLEIHVCTNAEKAMQYLKEPLLQDEVLLLAEENEKITGHGRIQFDSEIGKLQSFSMDEPALLLLMVQAMMNFLERRGVAVAVCTDKKHETLLKSLGFQEKNGALTCSLQGYFTPGAHCNHK